MWIISSVFSSRTYLLFAIFLLPTSLPVLAGVKEYSTCLCHGGTLDTILDETAALPRAPEDYDAVTATVPFELQRGTSLPLDSLPGAVLSTHNAAWQTSASFSCPLTPAVIHQCHLPDLDIYINWDSLDFDNYDSHTLRIRLHVFRSHTHTPFPIRMH